jgi:hypothetical protein
LSVSPHFERRRHSILIERAPVEAGGVTIAHARIVYRQRAADSLCEGNAISRVKFLSIVKVGYPMGFNAMVLTSSVPTLRYSRAVVVVFLIAQ